VTRRQGRRRKQLLGDPKEKTGYRKLKEERSDRTLGENSFWKMLWICRKVDYRLND